MRVLAKPTNSMCLSFDCIHGSCFIYFTDSGVLGKIKRYWVLIVSISEEISQNIRQSDCRKPRKYHSLFPARSRTPVDATQPNANVWFLHCLFRSSLLLFQDHEIEYEVNFNLAFTNLRSHLAWREPQGRRVSLWLPWVRAAKPGPASSCASQMAQHWKNSWGSPKTRMFFKCPAQGADTYSCNTNTHLVLGIVSESDRKSVIIPGSSMILLIWRTNLYHPRKGSQEQNESGSIHPG